MREQVKIMYKRNNMVKLMDKRYADALVKVGAASYVTETAEMADGTKTETRSLERRTRGRGKKAADITHVALVAAAGTDTNTLVDETKQPKNTTDAPVLEPENPSAPELVANTDATAGAGTENHDTVGKEAETSTAAGYAAGETGAA